MPRITDLNISICKICFHLNFLFQDLINLICDVKSMEEAVKEMKYDAKKAPLGIAFSLPSRALDSLF